MKPLLFCALAVMSLAGCKPVPTTEVAKQYDIPRELADCKTFAVTSQVQRDIIVMRCPNSTTMTQWSEQSGKVQVLKETIVIDGVEYNLTKKEPE